MRKILVNQEIKDNKSLWFDLSGNHSIVKITANVVLTDKKAKVSVEYAQNAVINDLVFFEETVVDKTSEISFDTDIPFEASHISIYTDSDNAEIKDVCIYEEQDIDFSECYPKYFDFDLGKNYFLDTVSVFTSVEGYQHYSLYTSLNGRDFDFIARKTSDESCPIKTGDIYNANQKEARIVRVYIEYNSASASAGKCSIKWTGKESSSQIMLAPALNIPEFSDSPYNIDVTAEDTYSEVYGIIERRIGKSYIDWFELKLADNPQNNGLDFFEISTQNKRVLVKANSGVNLACGINYYLKYFCNINISQVGDQISMPDKIVPIKGSVFKETKAKVRYAYNYCTLSYSMAFWGEKEWQDELDWLALNGVNVVLDTTAQEEVWRRFLLGIGYSHEEIKKYITGPAYYAWAYMANMSGFGGPVHDSWFEERTDLARHNHLIMRKLGMFPVLQGYSGMVPTDIKNYNPDAETINQGNWCSFKRPDMLKTTSETFKEYAKRFYDAQKEVYGTYSKYFATDPFHEGGNTGGMSLKDVSICVLSEMIKSNSDAVWIIQSWQSNPKSELLSGLEKIENGKEHALILDLYAEKTPHHNEGCPDNPHYGTEKEFAGTPWIYCMLNNFGGRLGLHGHLDNMAKNIPSAFNTCKKIQGIGITPEASINNPLLYDFLFECIWQDDVTKRMKEIKLDSWLKRYASRRYGKMSKSAYKALKILKETVYKAMFNNLGQGAPECVFNARPALSIQAASTWGNAVISYDKIKLEKALKLLAKDYNKLKVSGGYIYDLVTASQQVLSNKCQDVHSLMVDAFNKKDKEAFKKLSDEFISLGSKMEEVTSHSKYYMLGTWISQAKALAENTDDFTKNLFEMNAKALITTWGAYNQAETGKLHDYSNRQWSGLIEDFYKKRWEIWICERLKELNGEPFEEKINWFNFEWSWVLNQKDYPIKPKENNLNEIVKSILK